MHFLILLFLLFGGCAVQPLNMARAERAKGYVEKGVLLLDQLKFDDAEAAFLLSLKIEPTPQGYDGLGCVAFRRGDYNAAELLYKKVIEKYPWYRTVYGNLALLFDTTGRHDGARELYYHASKILPENVRVQNNFGAHLFEHSDRRSKEEGILTLRQARVVGPNPVIEENLKRARLEDGYGKD